jgi:hypothetical protein
MTAAIVKRNCLQELDKDHRNTVAEGTARISITKYHKSHFKYNLYKDTVSSYGFCGT